MELSPYQLEGAKWLAEKNRAILADPPGLGKTAQAIAACDLARHKRILVVAPKSLVRHWVREIMVWSKQAEVCETDTHTKVNPSSRWVVTNYETAVRKDLGSRFDCLVVDEAIWIKNRKAQRTRAVRTLARHITSVYLLMGELTRGKPDEIWSPLHVLNQREFSSYWRWVDEFCLTEPVRSGGRIVTYKVVGVKNNDKLMDVLSHYILRRDKSILGLPEKREENLYIGWGKEQAKVYLQMKKVLVAELQGNLLIAKNALERLIRLRQIADDTRLVGGQEQSPKTQAIIEFIQGVVENGHSVLVFTTFAEYAKLIETDLQRSNIKASKFIGAMSKNERESAEQLMAGRSSDVLVATYGAAGHGLNLQVASIVCLADLPWTPDAVTQAQDRAWRRGQTKEVTVVSFLTERSIDEYVKDVLEGKQKFVDSISTIKTIMNNYGGI